MFIKKSFNRKYIGQGISTKLKNLDTGREYIISTATDVRVPVWQLSVFAFKETGADPYRPLLFKATHSFIEAEKLHISTEKLVAEHPESDWMQSNIPMLKSK